MNLDREIEDLLAVDHSPEFAARVRARVAAEPAPAASWWSWRLVPASAGLAALIAAAVLWPAGPPDTVSGIRPSVAPAAQLGATRVVEPPPSDAGAPAAVAPAAPRAAAGARATAAVSVPRRDADIVISPEDGRAFRLLLTRVREGLVVALPEGDADEAVVGPPWIEIAPVVIEPLAHLAQDEGGRQ